MNSFGFILTRHVNSEKTNHYWNRCIKLIRTFYPFSQIIIIDDNSKKKYIKSEVNYKNVTIIESEYPGRGELLPYIYFLKYRWFKNAVILHDSIFIHKHIPFELLTFPVMPLWHHAYDKENLPNLLRIASVLDNSGYIMNHLNQSQIETFGINTKHFELCFGSQSYINLKFLDLLENKYHITRLVHVIRNRTDRCGLERILGLLFCLEYPGLYTIKSLFGNIKQFPNSFVYKYVHYIKDFNNKKVPRPFVKVWTGR